MPEPLSEEKLAELEARAKITPYAAYEALPSLLAEVRLGREALKALEGLRDGVTPALYDDEITANDPRSRARMVEHLRKLPALLRAASNILRKAGRR